MPFIPLKPPFEVKYYRREKGRLIKLKGHYHYKTRKEAEATAAFIKGQHPNYKYRINEIGPRSSEFKWGWRWTLDIW